MLELLLLMEASWVCLVSIVDTVCRPDGSCELLRLVPLKLVCLVCEELTSKVAAPTVVGAMVT